MEQITDIVFRAVISALCAVLTFCAVPYLRRSGIMKTVAAAVRAAEKLARCGRIEKSEKNGWVKERLNGLGIARSDYTDMLIEAAVEELSEAYRAAPAQEEQKAPAMPAQEEQKAPAMPAQEEQKAPAMPAQEDQKAPAAPSDPGGAEKERH